MIDTFHNRSERFLLLPASLVRFRKPLVVGTHLALIPLAYVLAFLLRFDFDVPARYWEMIGATLPYLLAVRLATFSFFGLFRGWWRHVGVGDLRNLLWAVTLSSVAFLAILFLTGQLDGLPRSALVLDWGIAILLFGGARFAVRMVRESDLGRWRRERRNPALMIGAGDAAESLLRKFRREGADSSLDIVGMVDDDPVKWGMSMHGVSVLGSTEDLQSLTTRLGIHTIVIAIPSASREQMQRVVERCIATGVEFKMVPSLQEMMDGRARLSELRQVQIEDLLGRDTVQLDLDSLRRDILGKTVLVTGGAGSIGSELARQLAGLRPERLVLIDQAESALYFTHLEIAKAHPELDVVPVIADITDQARIQGVFAEHLPNYVFHAAAYKHVPLMEHNVMEAVRNNALGTLYVAQCAARVSAERFVLISTDKAVHPSSVMGATKRIAERIVLGWPSLRASRTDFRAVRFGNVLGSDGSVIPLFKRQLAAGQPLTVTHPDVTRYFMTIPEAVQLVLQAAILPEAAGRISMLDMGEPVRIVDLAENLLRLSGLEPYKDVPIVFTGLRPGEKLHEELMSTVEATVPTAVNKIRVVQTDEADGALIQRAVDRLAAELSVADRNGLVRAICALVPECVNPLRDAGLAPEPARPAEPARATEPARAAEHPAAPVARREVEVEVRA
jgi:FlaA1/EpsC-like NDP-sugar epimerase